MSERLLKMLKCERCGHEIIDLDIKIGVANKKRHNKKLCNTLDFIYGIKKVSRRK